jgi:hypothetical protein
MKISSPLALKGPMVGGSSSTRETLSRACFTPVLAKHSKAPKYRSCTRRVDPDAKPFDYIVHWRRKFRISVGQSHSESRPLVPLVPIAFSSWKQGHCCFRRMFDNTGWRWAIWIRAHSALARLRSALIVACDDSSLRCRLIRAEGITLQRIPGMRKSACARSAADVAYLAEPALAFKVVGRM